jgi:hypothetical protein
MLEALAQGIEDPVVLAALARDGSRVRFQPWPRQPMG